MTYLPLFGEQRCAVCGRWRGEHSGCSADDTEMLCPVDDALTAYFGVVASFVPAAGSRGTP